MIWSNKLQVFRVTLARRLCFLNMLLCVIVCYTNAEFNAEVLRPRGVPLTRKAFYNPTTNFQCMDGMGLVPFAFVNDDYCDCIDGSDEPGTSACIFGKFNCANAGYISMDIPSSRVNDKICDCCDGSDEYNSGASCPNTCFELGKKAQEEAQKKEELFNQGFNLWQEYAAQGKEIKEENKVKLQNLKMEETAAEKIKNEKEALKLDAEAKEKSALSKYETVKDEQKRETEEMEMQKHEEEERISAENAFRELDINQDGVLKYDEIQQFKKFDSNHDGVVSENEGKFFLHMKDSMQFEEFVTTGWMIMKPLYEAKVEPAEATEYSQQDYLNPPENEEPEETDDPEEDLTDYPTVDDEVEPEPPAFPPTESSDTEKPQANDIKYDDETQELINVATSIRQEYKEASDKLDNIKSDIQQIENDLETDFGHDEQFAVLKGQCFDHDDREYTYRLCPFDKASQIPKSGGSETNLGKWGSWIGPENNKFLKMRYENGLSCWNGPSRSTVVLLHCGLENKILSASEPNRCEYLFEFSTPALCIPPETGFSVHEHTEL